MITSEESSDRNGCLAWAQPDRRRSISPRLARSTLIWAVAGAAFLSPIAGSVALAETLINDVASGVAVDWRRPWEGRAGYPAASAVSSTATAAQSKGVVLINTVLPYDNASGAGTGMVLTASGQVLTSYHVVEGASTIKVTVAETGKTYRATVVGSDQTSDVALVQLQGASGLATIKIDNDATSVGDKVTAVGNAGGTGTLTAAKGTIVSLKASITTAAEGPVAPETLTGMIETTADVVSGDSGGPLYDADGEAVGIVTAPLADHDPGDRIKIVWIDQAGNEQAATVTLGASPVA